MRHLSFRWQITLHYTVFFILLALTAQLAWHNLSWQIWGVSIFLVGVVIWVLAGVLSRQIIRPLEYLHRSLQKMDHRQPLSDLLPPAAPEMQAWLEAFGQAARNWQQRTGALQTEQGKLRAVLDAMTDGVLILGPAGEVVLLNPVMAVLFNLPPENHTSHTLSTLLQDHRLVDLWHEVRKAGAVQSISLEIPSRKRFYQVIALPLDERLPEHTLLIFQNLTRLRQLETVRQDFISNLSHELRTPLASLQALTETLLSGALDDPPAARRFLGRIHTEVEALSHMVGDLLDLSRIESGKMALRLQTVQIEDLLQSAIDRMQYQAEQAGISLQSSFPEYTPPVLADSQRIGQVLVNLLHNALKFTPQNGRVVLSAVTRGDQICVCVQDTGIGIPPEALPRVFERFYKVDRARSGGGTGLGLSISRHIVETHGGRIWAESVEGQGASFFFTLPIDE